MKSSAPFTEDEQAHTLEWAYCVFANSVLDQEHRITSYRRGAIAPETVSHPFLFNSGGQF